MLNTRENMAFPISGYLTRKILKMGQTCHFNRSAPRVPHFSFVQISWGMRIRLNKMPRSWRSHANLMFYAKKSCFAEKNAQNMTILPIFGVNCENQYCWLGNLAHFVCL
jgi:hypothetical protein